MTSTPTHVAASKTVGIVVLSWNRRERLLACLDRLQRLGGVRTTLIVVDNASVDGSVDAVRAAYPDAVVLPQSTNLGFVGGVNAGLTEAMARGLDYAWLINDDTSFDDTILATLVADAVAHPSFGVFSPAIRDWPDEADTQFDNGVVDWRRAMLVEHMPAERFARFMAEGATPVLIGTALLCDLRALPAIGLFDTRYFAYWEDIDFSVRAARAGHPCRAVPGATVLHDAPDMFARAPYYHYYLLRNEAIFFRTHARERRWLWWRKWIAKCLHWLGKNRTLGQPEQAQACADALWHGILRRHGRREDLRPAPRILVRLLSAHPRLLERIIAGQFAQIAGQAFGRKAPGA